MALPPVAQKIFQQISMLGSASTGDLVSLVSYSRPVVIKNLRLLEAQGLVQRVGKGPSDPHAHWIIPSES